MDDKRVTKLGVNFMTRLKVECPEISDIVIVLKSEGTLRCMGTIKEPVEVMNILARVILKLQVGESPRSSEFYVADADTGEILDVIAVSSPSETN